MAHLLAAVNVAVYKLHHLAGVEAVGLAQVDEQAAVALLGLAPPAGAALGAAPLFLLAAARRLLYLGGVGVVGQEAAELAAHHLLYHVFLVDELEVAVYLVHERGYLFLVDVYLHYLVHHLVELLGAYLLGRGQLALNKLLAYLLLHCAYLATLARVDYGYRGALLAGAARAARAVGVALYVVGHAEVDDVGQVVNVEAAGGHVGGHEQLGEVLAELLHRKVALLLREVAVQRLGVVAVAYELVGHLLRLALRAAEDDGEYAGVVVYHALQGQVLVLGAHHVVDVVHVLGAFVAAAHHNLLVVAQVRLGYLLHLAAHSGREEQRVAVFGQALEYLVDAVGEAHVEHLVGLVEHHVAHAAELGHAAVLEVDEAAGGGHDDLCAVAQGAHLVLYRRAAVDGHDVDASHVLGEVFQVVCNLQAKLARGAEHQRLGVAAPCVYALQHGYAEGGCLARAGLCQRDYVVAVAEQIGDYFFLYGHGALEAQLRDGAANLFADAQFFKCLQSKKNKIIRIIAPCPSPTADDGVRRLRLQR